MDPSNLLVWRLESTSYKSSDHPQGQSSLQTMKGRMVAKVNTLPEFEKQMQSQQQHQPTSTSKELSMNRSQKQRLKSQINLQTPISSGGVGIPTAGSNFTPKPFVEFPNISQKQPSSNRTNQLAQPPPRSKSELKYRRVQDSSEFPALQSTTASKELGGNESSTTYRNAPKGSSDQSNNNLYLIDEAEWIKDDRFRLAETPSASRCTNYSQYIRDTPGSSKIMMMMSNVTARSSVRPSNNSRRFHTEPDRDVLNDVSPSSHVENKQLHQGNVSEFQVHKQTVVVPTQSSMKSKLNEQETIKEEKINKKKRRQLEVENEAEAEEGDGDDEEEVEQKKQQQWQQQQSDVVEDEDKTQNEVKYKSYSVTSKRGAGGGVARKKKESSAISQQEQNSDGTIDQDENKQMNSIEVRIQKISEQHQVLNAQIVDLQEYMKLGKTFSKQLSSSQGRKSTSPIQIANNNNNNNNNNNPSQKYTPSAQSYLKSPLNQSTSYSNREDTLLSLQQQKSAKDSNSRQIKNVVGTAVAAGDTRHQFVKAQISVENESRKRRDTPEHPSKLHMNLIRQNQLPINFNEQSTETGDEYDVAFLAENNRINHTRKGVIKRQLEQSRNAAGSMNGTTSNGGEQILRSMGLVNNERTNKWQPEQENQLSLFESTIAQQERFYKKQNQKSSKKQRLNAYAQSLIGQQNLNRAIAKEMLEDSEPKGIKFNSSVDSNLTATFQEGQVPNQSQYSEGKEYLNGERVDRRVIFHGPKRYSDRFKSTVEDEEPVPYRRSELIKMAGAVSHTQPFDSDTNSQDQLMEDAEDPILQTNSNLRSGRRKQGASSVGPRIRKERQISNEIEINSTMSKKNGSLDRMELSHRLKKLSKEQINANIERILKDERSFPPFDGLLKKNEGEYSNRDFSMYKQKYQLGPTFAQQSHNMKSQIGKQRNARTPHTIRQHLIQEQFFML